MTSLLTLLLMMYECGVIAVHYLKIWAMFKQQDYFAVRAEPQVLIKYSLSNNFTLISVPPNATLLSPSYVSCLLIENYMQCFHTSMDSRI